MVLITAPAEPGPKNGGFMEAKNDFTSPEFHQAQLAKIYTEIEKMRIETEKARKELKWYEVSLIIAVTLAIVAVAKIFI